MPSRIFVAMTGNRRLAVAATITAIAAALVGCVPYQPRSEAGLLRITTSPHEEMEPQWSPDGLRLSYGSGREGDQNVVVYDFDTRTETQLTQGLGFVHSTTWSPDGSRIAYVTTRQTERGLNSHIYVVDVSSRNVRQVTREPSIDGSPSWSPDGARVVFPSKRSGVFNLWIQSLDQDDARMVTDHPETDHGPEWSPDGRSIAFHSDRGASTSIWILNTEDGSLTKLTDDAGNDHYPDWSPDGRYIAFSSDRSGNHDIWIKPVSIGGGIQVTTSAASDTRPSWSPDGRTLAFTSDREKSMDIWVVDAPVQRLAGVVHTLQGHSLRPSGSDNVVALQYRVVRDAIAPSSFVAVVGDGITSGVILIWKLPPPESRQAKAAQRNEKARFHRLIEMLESRQINGVEFECTGELIGFELHATGIPRLTARGSLVVDGLEY